MLNQERKVMETETILRPDCGEFPQTTIPTHNFKKPNKSKNDNKRALYLTIL